MAKIDAFFKLMNEPGASDLVLLQDDPALRIGETLKESSITFLTQMH